MPIPAGPVYPDAVVRLRTLPAALVAAAAAGCVEREMPGEDFGLDCIFDFRRAVTDCANVDRQLVDRPTTSDSRELHIRSVEVRRAGDGLAADIDLTGRFFHDPDQNIYLFLGGPAGAPGSVTYALSGDPAFFEGVGYEVRGAVSFPHRNDVRIGVMSVSAGGYSPQVYLRDARTTGFAAGEGSGIVQRVEGSRVHLEIPVRRYYEERGEPIPPDLGVTVATARDYVGFIDQATATGLADGGAVTARGGDPAPAEYPTLDPDSHVLERVRLVRSGGGVSVEIDTRAPILDWAQTNLHLFLLPVEPYRTGVTLLDPSHARAIPYKWSHYCGVYSPRRVFCKPSRGADFSFDGAYSERTSLEPPPGVAFRVLAGGRYAIDLSGDVTRAARAGRPTFAVMISIGRDGFPPTSWYGASGAPEAPGP